METTAPLRPSVRYWLLAGLVMVFFQVIIGGVTRLTDSGLSITEWAVIQGTLPPAGEAQWIEAFEAYKTAARKQYETLHADMTLGEFKVIYFWEYLHRLWARLMGLVFLIPFLFFWAKKWIPSWLMRLLGLVILLASMAAIFGMIMVNSGLNNDTRTWVNAYNLIIHLLIAAFLFGVLCWTWLLAHGRPPVHSRSSSIRSWGWGLAGLLVFQISLGGLMAGMRAGLIHPHFPFFIQGEAFMKALTMRESAAIGNWIDYEPSLAVKAWVQMAHRGVAYVLSGLAILFILKLKRWNAGPAISRASMLLLAAISLQFLLGVLTILNSVGRIPLVYGVLHQGGALLLLASILYITYLAGRPKKA